MRFDYNSIDYNKFCSKAGITMNLSELMSLSDDKIEYVYEDNVEERTKLYNRLLEITDEI